MKSIRERLQIFYGRLAAAPVVSTAEEALIQINETLDAVEDEFSGLPYDPGSWKTNRRLYGPDPAFEREIQGWPNVRKFRQTEHSTFIGANGSFEIQWDRPSPRAGEVVFSKKGSDGKGVWEQ